MVNPISKIFDKKPPLVLYHYTTQEGLIGIIEKRSIWATKIQYLNDTQEFKLALDLAKEILLEWESPNDSIKQKVDGMIDDLKTIPDINVFVCSFSEQDDLLSQWRAYSPSGNGYSIGFSTEILLQRINHDRFGFLVPCIYDVTEQREIIKQLIGDILNNLNISSAINCYNPSLGFLDCLITMAPILKHHKFKEEEEWRLITSPKAAGIKYRPGKSKIIPYVEFKYCSNKKSCVSPLPPCEIISRLIIGPSPELNLKKNSVESILQYNSFKKYKVVPTEIPYRDW